MVEREVGGVAMGDGAAAVTALDSAPVAPELPGEAAEESGRAMLPPLAVSALMVTKADLIRALRVYVPHLADIEALDGERFLLTIGHDDAETAGGAR